MHGVRESLDGREPGIRFLFGGVYQCFIVVVNRDAHDDETTFIKMRKQRADWVFGPKSFLFFCTKRGHFFCKSHPSELMHTYAWHDSLITIVCHVRITSSTISGWGWRFSLVHYDTHVFLSICYVIRLFWLRVMWRHFLTLNFNIAGMITTDWNGSIS